MNNDAPQIFGEDTRDYPIYPGSLTEQDGEDFPAFRGWGERVEPVAPHDEYPQPSFDGYEPASYEPEYPLGPGPGRPAYPQGRGYAPDSGYARELGYPHDPDVGAGFLPGQGYVVDHGYVADLGFAKDAGYPGDTGFGRDAEPVPVMEPLPDPGDQAAMSAPVLLPTRGSSHIVPPLPTMAPGPAPPEAAAPLPTRVPPPGPDGHRAFRDQVLAPPPVNEPEYARETSDSLTTESLLHGKRAAPGSGWRRSVYRATGGLLRFGESAAEMRRRDLVNRVRTPAAGGHHRVAVLSLKGGVGKTTTAVGLGATLATLRGDRVIAVDANPDRGTLSDKVRLETAATIRDLLNERDQVSRYADLRAFTSQAPSRLEVLASDRDPAVSVAFGADDYCDVAQVLEHFYSICITDCGTGLLHSAMSGVLQLADQIILVSSPSVDGARSASATLDWLEAHNCADLVRNGVVVLSAIRPKSKSSVDLDRLERHFASRCRAVARIPYDPHLEEGAEIELELLGSDTAEAYLALAAIVGDGLA
jgi:MinD-like ATPase involved in chromosome partitioning or flagellar assembly